MEVFSNRFPDLGFFDVVDICHHVFNGAVLLQQCRRSFLANAWDIWDVIRAIAFECTIVDELNGCQAVAFDNFVMVVDDGFRHALDGDHD